MRYLLLLSLSAASLPAQWSDTIVWTGTIERSGTASIPAGYRVTSGANATGIELVTTTENGERVARATDVRFNNVTLTLRVPLPASEGDAACALEAMPSVGYRGPCILASGDTAATMTMAPPMVGLLIPEHEIALARDAAPPNVASNATVFGLTPRGFVELARGTNGFVCFIERSTPTNAWPICHTRPAGEALARVEQLRASLRAAGLPEPAIIDSIDARFKNGKLRPPPAGSLSYMLSNYAWTVTASGKRVFLGPHLHVYEPFQSSADLGIDTTSAKVLPMRVEREHAGDASVIIPIKVLPKSN